MTRILVLLAREGRYVLLVGLLAGILLPQVGQVLRPWLSQLVLLMLFLTAFRVGFPKTVNGLRQSKDTLYLVLIYQVALPIICIGIFSLFGYGQSPVAIALTLMLAAPAITGSPNIATLLGLQPEAPFRVLVLGTLLMPITIIPVFWLSPALGNLSEAFVSAFKLGLALSLTILCAFFARQLFKSEMTTTQESAVDGAITLILAIVVIGFMSAVSPTLQNDPMELAGWLILVLVLNIVLQVSAYLILNLAKDNTDAAPLALSAGNRNVSLFLIISSVTDTDSFLMFLGCYQIPMYLTPFFMRPFLGRRTIG